MKSALNIILSLSLAGAVSLIFIAKDTKDNLDRHLKASLSNEDSLTKKSQSLEKESKKFKSEADSLASKNSEQQKTIGQANSKLFAMGREITNARKSVDEVNKKCVDLQKDWEKQLAGFKSTSTQLQQDNKGLTDKLTELSETNNELTKELVIAHANSKDNILIQSMKKNGSLNVKGKKVRKIVTSLDVCGDLKNPAFRIFNPNGIPLSDQMGSFDYQTINDKPMLGGGLSMPKSTKINLTYSLKKKIGPGIYRIEMLNDNKHAGNILVNLR